LTPSRKTLIFVGLIQVAGRGDHVSSGQLSIGLVHKLNDRVKFYYESIVALVFYKCYTLSLQVKLYKWYFNKLVFISNEKFGYEAVLKVFVTPGNKVVIDSKIAVGSLSFTQ